MKEKDKEIFFFFVFITIKSIFYIIDRTQTDII
jgi:hypothetical protein